MARIAIKNVLIMQTEPPFDVSPGDILIDGTEIIKAGPDAAGYMERYPGDDVVDLLGLDCYQYGEAPQSNGTYSAQLKETLAFMTELGKEHGKPIALTETGFEGIPYEKWWTEVLYPAVKDYPLSYVLVWRNAWDMAGHFYGPWKGTLSETDFLEFAALPEILLLSE